MKNILLILTFVLVSSINLSAEDTFNADPFSDMAELDSREEEEEEEAIERFYAYGRILHLELFGSADYFRGPMSNIYHRGWLIGGRIAYFLDWDVAITFHMALGKANVEFENPNVNNTSYPTRAQIPYYDGYAVLFNLGFGLKYYFNFNDISKAIAYINPAISAGAEVSIINDKVNIPINGGSVDPSHKSVAPGLFFGFSLEFPIFRRSILLGGDFIYHLSYFPSGNNKVPAGNANFAPLNYSGNYMTLGGKITFNL